MSGKTTNNNINEVADDSTENVVDDSAENVADDSTEVNDWEDLDMNVDLLRGIYAYGFEKPSPIQRKSISPFLRGRDIIAQAQSGTGKTGSFVIGALSKITLSKSSNQALILAPTHELAHQIAFVAQGLSSMMTGIRIKTIVGGSSIEEDAREMNAHPPHLIVGCPGRVYDMIRRRHLRASELKVVVVDEADEMLSIGFKEQVYNVFKCLNQDVQIALFSATFSSDIFRLAEKFMQNPVQICVKAEQLTLEGIKQYFVAMNDDHEKYLTLKDLYQQISLSQCIIYANSIRRVIDLYDAMKEDGFPVCCLHSQMNRFEREQVFADFRKGASRVLISSNVTSRGIDIQQVGIVINFDIPKDVHNYLHRIGRSGRWGRKGMGINFITRKDVPKIQEIEQYYSTQIEELPANFSNFY